MICAQCDRPCEPGALYGGLCGDCALEAMPPYMDLVALMADLHDRLGVVEESLLTLKRQLAEQGAAVAAAAQGRILSYFTWSPAKLLVADPGKARQWARAWKMVAKVERKAGDALRLIYRDESRDADDMIHHLERQVVNRERYIALLKEKLARAEEQARRARREAQERADLLQEVIAELRESQEPCCHIARYAKWS